MTSSTTETSKSFGQGIINALKVKQVASKLSPRHCLTSLRQIGLDKNLIFYVPGIFLISLALAAIFIPKVLLSIAAIFVFFLGLSSWLVARKVIQFKRRVEAALKGFEGQVIIQGVAPRQILEQLGQEQLTHKEGGKKITYH